FQAEDGIRDATVTGVQTCALPICRFRPGNVPCPALLDPPPGVHGPRLQCGAIGDPVQPVADPLTRPDAGRLADQDQEGGLEGILDRKSTRLNSSHGSISYAVFCLK